MVSDENAEKLGRLPIWATVADVYRFVFANLGGLIRAALLPFLLATAIKAVGVFLDGVGGAVANDFDLLGEVEAWFLSLLTIIALTPFVAKWHRMTLFGAQREPANIEFRLGRREWRFAGYYFFTLLVFSVFAEASLYLLLQALSGAPLLILFAMGLAFVHIIFYVFVRIAFVFPACAAGWKTSLRIAWDQTRDNGVRLTIAMLSIELPVYGLDWFLASIFDPQNSMIANIAYSTLDTLTWVMLTALAASLLSIAYLTLVGPPRELEATP